MPDFEVPEEELRNWVQALPGLALQAGEPAMTEALTFLHGQIPEYPEGQPVKPDGRSFLRTPAQRAFFFASVRQGALAGWDWVDGHPQKTGSARTGTLGRRFTEAVERSDQAVTGDIGTNLGYAPWVVGPDYPGETIHGREMYQARIHVERWWQFADVVEQNTADAWKVFEEEFWKEFQELVRQQNSSGG